MNQLTLENFENIAKSNGHAESGFVFEQNPGWPDRFGDYIREWAKTALRRPIRTLSIFSGAGGLDIGFHDAGFQVETMLEIDERFVETLRLNADYFGAPKVLCDDVRNFYPTNKEPVDFIIGGPPCQTFSAAGRRASGVMGTSDLRGTLFEQYVRLIKTLSPKGFIFENVYGLTGAENGEAWRKIQNAFSEAGYNISYRILDAADYGVPQHRERLLLVGTKRGDFLFPRPTHGPDSMGHRSYYPAIDAVSGVDLSKNDTASRVNGRYGHLLEQIPPGLNYSFFTEKLGHHQPIFAWRSKFSDFLYKADPETPVRTIKAQGGQYTGPFHWENRPFSVDELKRLQTIPDNYRVAGGRQVAIHQIGNSVPPQLARILALAVLNQIFNVKLPFNLPLLEKHQSLSFRKRKRLLTEIYASKAREALSIVSKGRGGRIIDRSYHADLSRDFGWNSSQQGQIKVNCRLAQKAWLISVSNGKRNKRPEFEIQIAPTTGSNWTIPSKKVLIQGEKLSPQLFTSSWKAFEQELIHNKLKADLPQLCGYYQYLPAIHAEMSVSKTATSDINWQVIKKVVSGIGVRRTISRTELGLAWQVSPEDVHQFALFLRSLGYEVRNSNTNPQIPRDHYLIPYVFPSLTPMSVQLRKSLEPLHVK